MYKSIALIFLLIFYVSPGSFGVPYFRPGENTSGNGRPDTLIDNQILYNGREWKNLYYRVKGDPFLFSKDYLPASLTLHGKTFNNIRLRYDLYLDEIILPFREGKALQLNREMVDRFSVTYGGNVYHFLRLPEDSAEELTGYVRVLCEGTLSLYQKYIKKIDRPGMENHPDRFYQITRIYLVKDEQVRLIARKGDFLKLLKEKKALIRNYLKKNALHLSVKEPESLVTVLRYCNSLDP